MRVKHWLFSEVEMPLILKQHGFSLISLSDSVNEAPPLLQFKFRIQYQPTQYCVTSAADFCTRETASSGVIVCS